MGGGGGPGPGPEIFVITRLIVCNFPEPSPHCFFPFQASILKETECMMKFMCILKYTCFVVDVYPVLKNFIWLYFAGVVTPPHLDHLN